MIDIGDQQVNPPDPVCPDCGKDYDKCECPCDGCGGWGYKMYGYVKIICPDCEGDKPMTEHVPDQQVKPSDCGGEE